MKNASIKTVLAICEDEELYDRFRAAAPEATECLRAESAEQAARALSELSPDLVVIEYGFSGGAEALVRRLRQEPAAESSQFLLVTRNAARAEIALLAGFDAAILASAGPEELRLAIRSAFLRRARLASVVEERDFLGLAIRREEGFSRMLLDRQLSLKSSFSEKSPGKGAVSP